MKEHPIDLGTIGRIVDEFTATLHRASGDLNGVSVRIEYDEYRSDGLKATLLHPALATSFGLKDLVDPDSYHCKMTALSPFAIPILFWAIDGLNASGEKIELAVSGYDIGVTEDPLPVGEEVTVFAHLTRGRLSGWKTQRVRRWDGTITSYIDEDKREEEQVEEIKWQEGSQTTTLRMNYEYEDAKLGDSKVLVQIARPVMVRTFRANGNQSCKSILEEAEKDLKDICLLLSLACREKVQWYQVSVETYKSNERPRLSPRAKRRCLVAEKRYSEHEDSLIEHRDLVEGGFKILLDQFRGSQHYGMLSRAIAFEIASREKGGGLEADYILCYSALEAIANETRSSLALPRYQPAEWKELKSILGQAISEFCRAHTLSAELEAYTKNKLAGLPHSSIADVLLSLTQALSIKVDDLWPQGVTFEQGLRTALKLRNALVHQALVSDPFSMHANLIRLQILVERFILKLIGWPDNKVWVWADQRLKRFNRTT